VNNFISTASGRVCRSWVGDVVWHPFDRRTFIGVDLEESLLYRKRRLYRSYTPSQSTLPRCSTTYKRSRESASYRRESLCWV